MANNTKKKAFLIGLGLFWATAITAISIAVPSILQKNSNNLSKPATPDSGETRTIKTTLLSSNEKQIIIKIDNLDDHLNEWLVVEYQPETVSEFATSSSTNKILTRTFFVNSKTEYVEIGGLIPSIKYNYQIKKKDKKILTEPQVMVTYSKSELIFNSNQNSISFVYYDLNKEYSNKSLIVRYKKYEDSLFSSNNYSNSDGIEATVELKEVEGKFFYALAGEIVNLEKSTPYILTLHISGQEGSISDPVIVWTKGNNAGLIVPNVSATTASVEVSGLDDYVSNPNSTTSFLLNYIKKGSAESIIQKANVIIGTDNSIKTNLTDLEPNTQYSIFLSKLEDDLETPLTSQMDFWTSVQPFVKEKSFQDVATSWRKSSVNSLMVVSGLKTKSDDSTKSLNFSDLQLVATEIAAADSTPNFSADMAMKVDLALLTPSVEDEYLANFPNLMPGKLYAIQLFKKIDTELNDPLLSKPFVQTQMPNLFTSDAIEITSNTAKVMVREINNYKTNEIVFKYWKATDATTKTEKIITFDEGATEIEIALDALDPNMTYEYAIFPIYPELQTDVDNLLGEKGTLTTKGFLTADSVTGNNFTEDISFKCSRMGNDFPVNKDVKLQWRIKPTATETVEWATPDETNSHLFRVETIPNNGIYTINLSNDNKINAFFTGVTYEWRILDPTNLNENLIKAGSTEFQLADDQITSTFTDKINLNDASILNWRAPLIDNIVGDKLGDQSGIVLWRPFFGLKNQKEMKDFLEWLAFQNEETIDKFGNHLKIASKVFNGASGDIDIPGKYFLLPYLPSNFGGEKENGGTSISADGIESETRPIFGGYNPEVNAKDTPIKPKDFMSDRWKFIDHDAVAKSMKYYLNGIKNGWNGRNERVQGITRTNKFLDGMVESKSETYASYLANKQNFDMNIKLSPISGKNSENWTLEVENSDNNFIVNDITGELYVKIKATKDEKTHYYWHKINGFKSTDSAVPAQTDLSFELYKDHARSARVIFDELQVATDNMAKKAIIQKYFRAKMGNIFTQNWKFVNAELVNNNINLKVTIPMKKVLKATLENLDNSEEIVSDTEFSYTLIGYDVSTMPTFTHFYNSRQKTNLTPAESGLDTVSRVYHISWTYEQMLNRMKDAVSKGDEEVNKLADIINSTLDLAEDWQTVAKIAAFRVAGKAPAITWGDFRHEDNVDTKIINDENKDTFFTRTPLVDPINGAQKWHKIKEMIQFYGQKPTS